MRQTSASKSPTIVWRKGQTRDLSHRKNISYTKTDTKTYTFTKIKKAVIPKVYEIEELTIYFFEVLRLPVGYSELNPIEIIWTLVKLNVAKKKTTFKISVVQKFKNITRVKLQKGSGTRYED